MAQSFQIKSIADWQRLRCEHAAVILPFTLEFRTRRGRGESHPVYDFLFTYYTLSTNKLEKWHPGFGVTLEVHQHDQTVQEYLNDPRYRLTEHGLTFTSDAVRPRDIKQLQWVRSLCKTILERPARFACLGLHEWAMVYRAPELRHQYALRLSDDQITTFLDEMTVCCSHFDAFRFFTTPATKLNVLQPGPDTRLTYEQGGCIHANMDLYKWAYKLSPLISSDILRECFLLALEAREIDMRASPYDFTALGFEPIRIETPSGQDEYRAAQRLIADKARTLRLTLLEHTERVLEALRNTKAFENFLRASELPDQSSLTATEEVSF